MIDKYKLSIFLGLISLSFLACGSSVSQAKVKPEVFPYADLQDWIDRMPSYDDHYNPRPAGQRFWDEPLVKKSLKAAGDALSYQLITSCWGGKCDEQAIKRQQQFLVISVCKKAACDENQAQIFLNLYSGEIMGCLRHVAPLTDGGQAVFDNWFEGGRRAPMGPGSCGDGRSTKELFSRLSQRTAKELSFRP